MSLAIKIVRVYAEQSNESLDCKCSIWIGNNLKKLDKLGKLYTISKTKKRRAIIHKQTKKIKNNEITNDNEQYLNEQFELIDEENQNNNDDDEDEFLTYYFRSSVKYKYGYRMEIYCYKKRSLKYRIYNLKLK
jgi:hypothetical protein